MRTLCNLFVILLCCFISTNSTAQGDHPGKIESRHFYMNEGLPDEAITAIVDDKPNLQKHPESIAQVAYEVGISNLSYFSKVFKEEFGVLPREYSVKET